jgi:hypothetical protein
MRCCGIGNRLLAIGVVGTGRSDRFGVCYLRTPGWYQPPVVAVEEQQLVRNNLVAAEQAMTESLLKSQGPFVYHLYQDDVNRWIAMRRAIYPLIDELAPPQLADPFVLFDESGVRLAGQYRAGGVSVILSIDIDLRLEGEELVLRAKGIRCGSAGLPLNFAGLPLATPIERDRERTWPGSPRIWGDFVSGVHLESKAWWKNGGMEYRVRRMDLQPGRIDFEIEPLGRHSAEKSQNAKTRRY